MTSKENVEFLVRTAAWFQEHRRRAEGAGKPLTFDLEQVRWLVERNLGEDSCPYCRGPVTTANFSVDHRTPLARGGKFSFRNIVVCCRDCSRLKGVLDDAEFRELMRLMAVWPKPVFRHVRACLEAGLAAVRPALPPEGSLKWFTGA